MGQVLAKRGSLQSPPVADHQMAELLEGEDIATGDGGGGVGGAAAGGGQGQQQQHARVSGLLKSEMSALPSLAGFGMGGSVSFDRARMFCDVGFYTHL